jgi:hypothetical protein
VRAAIRAVNRLECVGETMRHALNVLAEVAPDWLIEHMQGFVGKALSVAFQRLPLTKGGEGPYRVSRANWSGWA